MMRSSRIVRGNLLYIVAQVAQVPNVYRVTQHLFPRARRIDYAKESCECSNLAIPLIIPLIIIELNSRGAKHVYRVIPYFRSI
jgi:hypothetical protein